MGVIKYIKIYPYILRNFTKSVGKDVFSYGLFADNDAISKGEEGSISDQRLICYQPAVNPYKARKLY